MFQTEEKRILLLPEQDDLGNYFHGLAGLVPKEKLTKAAKTTSLSLFKSFVCYYTSNNAYISQSMVEITTNTGASADFSAASQ